MSTIEPESINDMEECSGVFSWDHRVEEFSLAVYALESTMFSGHADGSKMVLLDGKGVIMIGHGPGY
jgi:hypothetical protein